jgi:nucleoside-diphosphate-sugar epimerase
MELCGKDVDIEYVDPRPGDIMHSLADISNAKEKLNFEPKYDLTDGLKETVPWFQK